jgi:uncharacterized protein YbjT (DUF2867 family)
MILVTGAAGTVGSEVVKGLMAARARVRVGYRNRKPDAPGVDARPLDLDRPETIAPALAGIETVFLLSNTVTPELNLVRVARAAGVKRIVKLSVWRAPEEAYSFARWHRAVEREIEASGLHWTLLRPNLFMQSTVNFMGDTIRRDGAFYMPSGGVRVSQIDVRDIAAVAVAALTRPGHEGHAYDLSGPESLSFHEMAAILTRVLGRQIRYVEVPAGDYKTGAMAAGIPEDYADALVDLFHRYYRDAGEKTATVTTCVREVAGRDPIRYEQFARDCAAALR